MQSKVLKEHDWPTDWWDSEAAKIDKFRLAILNINGLEQEVISQVSKAQEIGYPVTSEEITLLQNTLIAKRYNEWLRPWMEHRYVEIDETGETVWVCHPYQLSYQDLQEILKLQSDYGFRISISGNSSYNPGGTVRVEIAAPEGETMPFAHPVEPQWLYRMWNQNNELLYVGISNDAFYRFHQHSKRKSWINEVARWERIPFVDREQVKNAEREAIRTEHPKYNVIHNA